MNILPQMAQITQRNTAKLHYFAEKDRLELVLFFWGVVRLRKSARSAGDLLGFSLCILIEYSYVIILPQITQSTQRNTASCIISQRKTDWDGVRLLRFCCLSA